MLYKLINNYIATLTKSNLKRLIKDIYIELKINKSFFILIRPSAEKLVSVFSIILIFLGDLLGIFSNKIRFLEYYNII